MSKLLKGLNSSQREAVTHGTGPLLIIAGPGSGKTRTVVHSIAYAIENRVQPDQILAFSFTVKASEELRDRVKEIVGTEKGKLVNISTFHSFCRNVLKEDIDRLGRGYTPNFKALEEKDQRKIVENLTRINKRQVRAEVDYIQFHRFPKAENVLNFIKKCKAREISPSDAGNQVPDPDNSEAYIKIYESYEQLLRTNGWIDYESQQVFTDKLLREVPDIRGKWQNKFGLIFVDEYQDTNPTQYRIIKNLAKKHLNLRVVGDDDQGIYGWRGADIQNILNFERDYPNAKVISLEQNYRSTQRIIETSRALAEFNPERREKELFTRNSEGEKVKYLHCITDEEEASTIATFIHETVDGGSQLPSDFAVLYRTNKQADPFKKAFNDLGIRYHVLDDSISTDTIGVSLMTIHKSKGLEFPNVFVTGICQDLLPHYHNRDEKNWDEELRLLYVAMTRAKNWLCLSSYEKDDQYPRGSSPFLEYIPSHLLESVDTLENIPILPISEDSEGATEYLEPLPEKLLGNGMTVLGVDPGNIGAKTTNVGWSITQKSFDGYNVVDYGTLNPLGQANDKSEQIKRKIDELITLRSPDAIAVEQIEVGKDATKEDWFFYVAGCVATIRSVAHRHGVECQLYTPQQVKYIATSKRNASKQEVQKGVMRICNLQQMPEPHHSADAIAASLCYLRNYLNSSRFEGNKRKQECYEAGYDYLNNGQYDAAVSKFQEAINIDPVYTDAHCGLGRVYIGQGDLETAQNTAKKSLMLAENNHTNSQNLLRSIECYHSGCNSLNNSGWNIAIGKFQESINLEPIFTEAHCGLSKAYLKIGKLGAAKSAAEEALRLRDEYPEALTLLKLVKMRYYYNGEKCFNRENYDQAILEFQKAVEIDPNFIGAHLFLGKTYFQLGRLEEAEKETKEALEVNRNYEHAKELLEEIKQKHKEQGDGYRKQKAYDKALKAYQHAIRIDDKYKEAYHNLGFLYRMMKKYDEAIQAYEKAIEIDKWSHGTYSNLSFVYRKIGDPDKAVDLLKRAIAIKPDYQRAYHNLADTYFEMKNLHDASNTILKALELDPKEQKTLKLFKNIQATHVKLGRNYFRQNDFKEAERAANAALCLDRGYQPGHKLLDDIKEEYYKLSLTYLSKNKWGTVEKFGKKVLEIDPNCEKTHYHLGLAYFKRDRLTEARVHAKKALSIQPSYSQARQLLSVINHPRNWLNLGGEIVRRSVRRVAELMRF